jgi:hypothetical protein
MSEAKADVDTKSGNGNFVPQSRLSASYLALISCAVAAKVGKEPKLPCFRIAANGRFANFTKKIRGQVLKMPSALCLKRYLKHTSMLILAWLSNVQWSQVKGYHWREAEIASREPHLG